jgi:ADP-ribosylglycohydrolase
MAAMKYRDVRVDGDTSTARQRKNTMLSPDSGERLARARVSLEGLSVGDAFGEQFFSQPSAIFERRILATPWRYTDDTHMALSIMKILRDSGGIDLDTLADSFVQQYQRESWRGYGPGMHRLLPQIRKGMPWHTAARDLFGGQGSFGNGAAMRVAPVGAFFADDLEAAVEQARHSAEVTHAHPEGIAGAIAVAVAAAWAFRLRDTSPTPTRQEFIDLILPLIPSGQVRDQVQRAGDLSSDVSVHEAAKKLGSGFRVTAQDTVPFVLWCAGQSLGNYEQALWLTASGLGDIDTTCAMVGGIVASYTGVEGIPAAWLAAREPLPQWPFEEA